jgi:hypothetical protein
VATPPRGNKADPYQSKTISRSYDYLKEIRTVIMNSFVSLAYFYAIGHLPKCPLFIISAQIKIMIEAG